MGMKQIGINTTKVVLAAIGAILLSDFLQLENSISAGIVAILTIQPTKRETMHTALSRCFAFLIALVISYLSFQKTGYNEQGFFLYLILFTLVCQRLGWISAIAMNSVIISHFIGFGNMEWGALYNEMMIFLIGIGAGIIANLHLHKNVHYMEQLKDEADTQMKKILHQISERMLTDDKSDCNGDSFECLTRQIRLAENIAYENYDNDLILPDTSDLQYIAMRKEQEIVLYEMDKIVRQLNSAPVTVKAISDYLERVSKEYHKENTAQELLDEYRRLEITMEQIMLPKDRSEFKDRALLYVLLKKIEEFLRIKEEFIQNRK